jgi:Protein of unknown function, DUF481
MLRMILSLTLGVVSLLMPPGARSENPPSVDVIDFTNGDRLSGSFVNATSDSVSFRGNLTGNSTFQWSDIRAIRLSGKNSLVLRKKMDEEDECTSITLSVVSVEVVGKGLTWKESDAHETSMAVEQLASASAVGQNKNARPSGRCSSGEWAGQVSSQDSVVTGTTKQYTVGATMHVAHDTGSTLAYQHRVLDVTGQASFGESAKANTSPIRNVLYAGILQYNTYLTESKDRYSGVYIFGLSDFYHNLSLGMNFEQGYGAGIGWQKANGTGLEYGVSGDIRYVNEDVYPPGKSVEFAAAGVSEHFSFPISISKDRAITIFERVIIFPAFDQAKAFQARGLAGLDMPLSKRLSVGIQFSDDYIQNAPPKSKQNYSKTQLSLKYSLGKLAPDK